MFFDFTELKKPYFQKSNFLFSFEVDLFGGNLMSYFDAKINMTNAQPSDIQYFVVHCYPYASEEQLLNIKSFIVRHSLQVIFKSPTNHVWIAALKTENGNHLKKLKGIKLVGGININSGKFMEATQPIVITQNET